MNILCLIPARSGSKGIKDKNIKLLNGKPLIAWTIEQAIKSKYKMKIVVSTDSEKYAKVAKEWGAEVPFIRPKEISQDLSTDIEFIKHAIEWLDKNEKYKPDIIIQLRPTSPLRKVEDIDKTLDIFIENYNKYDSLRSVYEIDKTPFKMYQINDNKLKPLLPKFEEIKEPFNCCRQIFPKTYLHNGYIDIMNPKLLNNNIISGNNIYPYIMSPSDNIDLDTDNDWVKLLM
jgi:CMP-N,N'-diacetyllegionaminic acid synthase